MKLRRLTAVLCAVALLLLVLPVSLASAESTTVAAFSYYNAAAVPEDNIELSGFGDKDTGYLATEGTGLLFATVNRADVRKIEWTKDPYVIGNSEALQPAMTGGTNNPWGTGANFLMQVSTENYKSLTFSALLGASKKGPRDFQLQYSTDNVTFTDIVGATYSITDNKQMEQAFVDVALPAAAENVATLYLRVVVTSNYLVNGDTGLVGSTGGEVCINDIVIKGEPSGLQGDVSGDGTVNMSDSLLLYRYTNSKGDLKPAQLMVSDMNADGTVNMMDALVLYRAVSGRT